MSLTQALVTNEEDMVRLTNEMRTQSSSANTETKELLSRMADATDAVGQGTRTVAIATSSIQRGGANMKYLARLTLIISSMGMIISALSSISSK